MLHMCTDRGNLCYRKKQADGRASAQSPACFARETDQRNKSWHPEVEDCRHAAEFIVCVAFATVLVAVFGLPPI